MRSIAVLMAVVPVFAGCSLLSHDKPAPAASASAPTAAAATGRQIEGVGLVPEWAPSAIAGEKCKPKDPSLLKKLDKGEEDGLSAGTADVTTILAEAGGCPAAAGEVATAINGGGYALYRRGHYDEANRWWRAALTLDPSHVLARYNLACGLVVTGKREDGLWALGEVARAARAGDAHAIQQLAKARHDEDLKLVRDTDAFKAAVALGGTEASPAPATEAKSAFSADVANDLGKLGVSSHPAGLEQLGHTAGALLSTTGKLAYRAPALKELYASDSVRAGFMHRPDIEVDCKNADLLRQVITYALGTPAAQTLVRNRDAVFAVAQSQFVKSLTQTCGAFKQLASNPNTMQQIAAQNPALRLVVQHPNFKAGLDEAKIVQRL